MHSFKVSLFFSSFLLILACNNKSNANKIDPEVSERSSEIVNTVSESSLDLTKYGIADYEYNVLGGLQVGDEAPNFKLPNQDGVEVSLVETLKEGPVVLVFLRAEWCSFCVKHLKEFQDHIQEIHQEGRAKIIAISPQESSYMKDFHDENQFSFPILFDEDHVAMKDYKVFFRVTDKYSDYIEEAKGKRVEDFNGDTNPYLPVPATYLIDKNQTIKYVHYDPDYKKRSNLEEVISLF